MVLKTYRRYFRNEIYMFTLQKRIAPRSIFAKYGCCSCCCYPYLFG